MRIVLTVTAATRPHDPDRFGTDSAWRVLRAACNAIGISDDGAELLRLGENALFHVPAGAGVIVRIARTLNYWTDVQNEVNVSRWLHSIGFPAARVIDVDQPLYIADHPVTFWSFIHGRAGSNKDIAALGRVLRELHAIERPREFTLPDENILGRVHP